jgi:hypothetical protein
MSCLKHTSYQNEDFMDAKCNIELTPKLISCMIYDKVKQVLSKIIYYHCCYRTADNILNNIYLQVMPEFNVPSRDEFKCIFCLFKPFSAFHENITEEKIQDYTCVNPRSIGFSPGFSPT